MGATQWPVRIPIKPAVSNRTLRKPFLWSVRPLEAEMIPSPKKRRQQSKPGGLVLVSFNSQPHSVESPGKRVSTE